MKWIVLFFLFAFLSHGVLAQDYLFQKNKADLYTYGEIKKHQLLNYIFNDKPCITGSGIMKAVNSVSNDPDEYPMHTRNTVLRENVNGNIVNAKSQGPPMFKKESVSKLFMKIYGGYGLFTPGSYRFNSAFSIHDSTTKTRGKRGIGNGLRLGGGIGLVLNDFLNLGIDGEFHKSSWLENSSNSKTDEQNYNSSGTRINYTVISISPYVIFKALAKPNYFIYNKLGLLFTLPCTLKRTETTSSSINLKSQADFNTFYDKESVSDVQKYKISLGLGLNVAFGINVKVNDRLRVFGEIFGNYVALSPKTFRQITRTQTDESLSFNYGNTNQLVIIKRVSTVTASTDYKQGGSFSLSGTYESDLPVVTSDGYTITNTKINTVSPKVTINMAVLGANLGFIYRF